MIEVLLSAFNGERWLREQLESLASQTYPDWRLLARDDGSRDGSRAVLEKFVAAWGRGRVLTGQNLGYRQSFFTLLQESQAPMVSFCDQDDVWLPEKLERAARALATVEPGLPAAHYSPFRIVDAALRPLGMRPRGSSRCGFNNALAECAMFGFTMTLNGAARDLVVSRLPSDPISHDWWCYLVVAATGRVLHEPEPMALYRRHDANSSEGARRSYWRRVRQFLTEGGARRVYRQAEELKALFGTDMKPSALATLDRFLAAGRSPTKRLLYALRPDIEREGFFGNLILRFLLLANRL
jgi:glycosyltransferase involved in cell wall biosynthesis